MKRQFPTSSFAILLAGLFLSATTTFAQSPKNAKFSGWRTSTATNLPAVMTKQGMVSQGVLTSGNTPKILSASLTAPSENRMSAQTMIDLGLGQAPASNDLIAETARALDYNWAQCYLFVRNQIRFTPYRGITRGPERTLLDREGSDGDQAFLLLALLRASGFTNNTTVMYAPPPVNYYTGGFAMPLGGTASGYDAATWLGFAATGTVDAVWGNVGLELARGALDDAQCSGYGDVSQWTVRLQHFWVQLTLDGNTYNLDPSFKPRVAPPPSSTLLSDMGYTRTNLLAQAGGTVTNDWYVRGIVTANLSAELRRLSANLTAKWQAIGTNVAASYFICNDIIVPQDLATDGLTIHGVCNGTVVDFLAQSAAYKNALRTSLTLQHDTLTTSFWLDEIATHNLWLSYTNVAGLTYPKAVLHLNDSVVTNEPSGYQQSSSITAYITMSNAFSVYTEPYSLIRSNANVYSIPIGFGGDHRGGMRERVQNDLGRMRAAGLPETDISLRSRVLQLVGQQWLAQTALLNMLDSRIKGSAKHFHYNIGISGQADSPYVDLKNQLTYSIADPAKFEGYMLFSSALEHAVLDQVNGTNRPAVSTIRVMDLANSTNSPIYLATPANWSTIRNSLTNYDAQTLLNFDAYIAYGCKMLLPKNGKIVLNRWSGCGYIEYSPDGTTGMMIGGGLNGGFTSVPGVSDSGESYDEYDSLVLQDYSTPAILSQDPVDMLAGASLVTRPDLALSGPMPLGWTRTYDSRTRSVDGPLGRGWNHGYDARVNINADPDALLGRGVPAACAPSVAASAVVADLLTAGESAQNMTIACLVAKWWTDQLVDNTATVQGTGGALTFARKPDGSYIAAPGVTFTFSRGTNGQFILQERLGRTWSFATNGTLTCIADPSGNATAFYYTNATCLVAVSNSFGSKFTLNWSGKHISSVNDTANRSVSYRYSPSGCLTGVTDAAGYAWKYSYDANNSFLAENDPSGLLTVSNAYNAFAQVTNQLSANGQRWNFAFAAGVGSWERDPFNNRTAYTYTEDGRLAQRMERDNTTNSFFYDGQGQVVSNLDAMGRVTINRYDSNNNLLSVTEAANTPNARTTSYFYDGQFHLVAVSNALGRVTSKTYDACHRLTSSTLPDGTFTTNTFDNHGLLKSTSVLDGSGRQLVSTTFGYDSRGFATNIASTDAGTVTIYYDNAGNATNIVDALGHPTRFWFDPRGFVTNTVNALTGRTVRVYNSAGRLTAAIDPMLRTNIFLWTASGHPAGMQLPNGGQTTNEYDAADRLMAARDQRGNRVALDLDSIGRATRRYTPRWQEQTWYDLAGCVTTRLDAVSGRTDIRYDNLNRPVTTTDPLRRAWTNYFDAMGTITGIRDPKQRLTSYGLDILDRRTSITYPSGRTEGFGFDALGRQTTFTNSEEHVYRMFYDAQNRLIAATNGATEQVFRNYFDPCGNLTNHLDGLGRPMRNQFDALNRCTNTVYSDGSFEALTFDAVGNLLIARNAATTNNFAYDVMNHLTSSVSRVAGVAFTNLYRYDLGGLATNVVYPGGKTVRYTFDVDGNVTNVTDWSNHAWSITRDAGGRMTALAYPNNINGAWGFDASSAVTNWVYTGAGTNLPGRSITRDKMGLKTAEKVTSGPMPKPVTNRRAVNTFDAADRLTTAQVGTGTNRVIETYRYDGCGALTNIAYSGGGAGTEPANYAYDCAGRMLSAATSNVSFSASYDALGNRIKTTINGVSRLWVIDHTDPRKRPLMETDTNGVPVRYYVWGAGRLLAAIDADGTTRYAHADEQGSIVALTSTNGTVLFTAAYGPYGEDWGRTGTNSVPFRWLGNHGVWRVSDAATLYLTRHRAYDTTMKRFLSQDPMGLGGGANLFAYANGNPLSYIDPLGLCGESIAGSALRGFGESLWNDGLNNMAGGFNAIASSLYNGVVGASAYAGRLGDDFSGTLNGTFNNPANAIQNTSWNSFENYMADGPAVALAVWGGGTMALGISPGTAAAESTIQQGTSLYRVFGNEARGLGNYYTTVNPATVSDFRTTAGLFPGNSGSFVLQGTLNNTENVVFRSAAPGPGGIGGGLPEVFVPNPATQINIQRVSGVNPPF